MQKSPFQRLQEANNYIYDYDRQIKYHDAEASRLRKIRNNFKTKAARAQAAIDRANAAAAYSKEQA